MSAVRWSRTPRKRDALLGRDRAFDGEAATVEGERLASFEQDLRLRGSVEPLHFVPVWRC